MLKLRRRPCLKSTLYSSFEGDTASARRGHVMHGLKTRRRATTFQLAHRGKVVRGCVLERARLYTFSRMPRSQCLRSL